MDFSLIIGILLGIGGLLFGYYLEGGNISSLVLISPFIIVVGGTLGAIIASYPINDILQALKSVKKSFKQPNSNSAQKIIDKVSEISSKFRMDGIIAIDRYVNDPDLQNDEFLLLKEGLILIQELKKEEDIQYILESEVRSFVHQKSVEVSIFESAAGYSPTMGVIGTVMGLIVVLSSGFGDPEQLALHIATAFIATLYGVAFANIIYLPIAGKLKSLMKRSKIQREMIIDGVCLIANSATARSVENELSLYYQAFADGDKKYRAGIDN